MGFDSAAARTNRWGRNRYRYAFVLFVCLLLSAFAASPSADYFIRIGGDYLTPLASALASEKSEHSDSPVALVVIDELTHRTAPFAETPEVAWTPYLGDVISAIHDAEPTAIGLDMIFPKTISSPGLAPGYDRAFLQALAKAGRSGKLILSEARLSETPIEPYMGQVIAVGGHENISPVHLTPDRDNVIRRHPASFALENGERVRSFAAELSARAGVAPNDDILIDYVAASENFPTYRFSDLYDCVAAGKREAFEIFRNKIILIGVALDIEDRHIAGNRLMKEKDPAISPSPCGGEILAIGQSINRASTAGVFIEARAVYTFLNGTAPRIPQRALIFLSTIILLASLSYSFFKLGPTVGALVLSSAGAALWLVSGYLFASGVLAPMLVWLMAGAILFVAVYSYRFILEDRAKRWITHAFAHYLNPALVQQLANEPETLKLGGERRRVAVLFADLAGFTTASEKLADQPETLVAHLNSFFEIMTAHIEANDGYVDKFIGDAVMGVWGAPVAMIEPERAAARAALACLSAVEDWNAKAANQNAALNMRIGLSAGEVVAGNLGSKKRFNYTVIGDAVNRAARLEQANKQFNTQILIDSQIADRLPEEFNVRVVEETQLRGQAQLTRIFSLEK